MSEFSAERILKGTFRDIFPIMNEADVTDTYRRLAMKWHPDMHIDKILATKVMAKLNELRDTANLVYFAEIPIKHIEFPDGTTPGRTHRISYLREHPFELGRIYIGNSVLAYWVDKKHEALFDSAISTISSSLRYANERMRVEMSRFLPSPQVITLVEGGLLIVMKKTEDVYRLRDVINFFNGRVPAKHVAWIVSCMFNMACYLRYCGLTHNAFTPDNYFISPKYHTGLLLGGWWYAAMEGSELTHVPKGIHDLMPPRMRETKKSCHLLDLECIKAIGREALGDRVGNRLKSLGVAPDPMVEWLRSPTSDNAKKEYGDWEKALFTSFGERKFIGLDTTPRDIYLGGM